MQYYMLLLFTLYVCMYVCMSVCTCVCMYVFVLCMYVCVCVSMYAVIQFIPTRSTHVCSVCNWHYVTSDKGCRNRRSDRDSLQHKGPQISSNTVKAAYIYCQSVRI